MNVLPEQSGRHRISESGVVSVRKWILAAVLATLSSLPALAFDAETAAKLAIGTNSSRVEALRDVVAQQDLAALPFLEKLDADAVKVSGDKAYIVDGDTAADPVTGAAVTLPSDAEDVVNSNRVRAELHTTMAVLRLLSPDAAVRLDAAKSLKASDVDKARLPVIQKALAAEHRGETHDTLEFLQAAAQLTDEDKGARLAAAKVLGHHASPTIQEMLSSRLADGGETDPEVRAAISSALQSVNTRILAFDYAGRVFTGFSLGSILLLAALGLAITYGLMGVINMAHGELIMIGAYATYVVQTVFRNHFPDAFQYYPVAAIPVAFLASGLVGIAIERSVLRFLYGRSLETLLATWGVSLILMQTVRTIFGAQNVEVENPVWMSGAVQIAPNLVLPYNRIIIILFSIGVVALMWWLLTRTRLGLFVRAVTQNRTMAGCIGVPTARVDTLAFGLGSGIAGLAGVALSQIGNVGPDLGQQYIVKSFMVVVLGGVGQLAGSVLAALGLGVISKFGESITGPVIAEICVLVFVIIFIQRRPQGLFALTGRSVE
jgi:urea transport system permease protein